MLMRLISQFQSSITKKLILSYLLVVFIPITLSGIYIAHIMKSSLQNEVMSMAKNQQVQMNLNVSEKIDLCIQITEVLRSQRSLKDLLLLNDYTDIFMVETINNDVVPFLNLIKVQNQDIDQLKIIHWNSRLPVLNNYLFRDKKNSISDTLSKLKKNAIEYKTFGDVYVVVSYEKVKGMEYTIYRPIYSDFGKPIGIIEIGIRDNTLTEMLKQRIFKSYACINLESKSGNILYSSRNDFKPLNPTQLRFKSDFVKIEENRRNYYAAREYIASIGCWVVFILPYNLFNLSGGNIAVIFLIAFAGFITLGLISYVLMVIIIGRLKKLSFAMNKVSKGDLYTSMEVTSKDEIGVLADNFNKMTAHIRELMESNERLNKAEKEAIYKALESQFNPHLIFNSLEIVRMTSELKNNVEISNTIELIMGFLRYNLSRKQKYVTVRDELNIALDYVEIYNLVNNNKIQVAVNTSREISGRLNEYQMLKFIIQPIVENSIMHGFQGKSDICHILINIEFDSEIISIQVEDNGEGISPKRMDEINKNLDLSTDGNDFISSGNGIGLRNISERLKINYGDGYGIYMESSQGFGTLVTVKIPAIRELK